MKFVHLINNIFRFPFLFYLHDDVLKWKKHFPRYWPFVWGIHRSSVNSPHKGQWHGALMFSLICVWMNGWVTNRQADDLRRHQAHYDVIVMCIILHLVLFHSSHHLSFLVSPCLSLSVRKVQTIKIITVIDILRALSMNPWLTLLLRWVT